MKIWIINPYATLPNEKWREDRVQILATKLSLRGDEVLVWTSNFIHRSKEKRIGRENDLIINSTLSYKIIEVPPYKKHISFNRILTEITFSKKFYKESQKLKPPDVIILADPALFFSWGVLMYLRKSKYKNIKLIIDIIDIWPELFYILLPRKIRFLGKYIFSPFIYLRKILLTKANGIIAVSNSYAEIASQSVKNKKIEVVYWGMDYNSTNDEIIKDGTYNKSKDDFWLLYAGTLGDNYDLKTILDVSKKIKNKNIKIFIAGDGNLKNFVVSYISEQKLSNIIYLGSLSSQELNYYYESADVGITSYVKDSTVAMPIKIYDYMKFGMPIINSLGKDLGDLVLNKKIGIQYEPENSESMLNAIYWLFENKDKRENMAKNMLSLAKEFDYSLQYSKYLKFVDLIYSE